MSAQLRQTSDILPMQNTSEAHHCRKMQDHDTFIECRIYLWLGNDAGYGYGSVTWIDRMFLTTPQ